MLKDKIVFKQFGCSTCTDGGKVNIIFNNIIVLNVIGNSQKVIKTISRKLYFSKLNNICGLDYILHMI